MEIRTRLLLLTVVTALGFVGSPTLAGKGGNGKPGGGGGDPPADPAIAFLDDDALVVVNADGSNRTVILEGGSKGWPSWSPDGSQLAFRSDIEGLGIYVVDVDGNGLRKVIAKNTRFGARVDWSPVPAADGRYKIAFSDQVAGSAPSSHNDIFLVNLDGTGLVNVTNTPDASEFDPAWSPEADRLAVDLAISGPWDVLVCDLGLVNGRLAVTGTLNLLSDTDVPGGPLNDPDVADVVLRSWAKTQDLLVVQVYSATLNGSDQADLWVIDLADPADPVNITNSPGRGEERGASFSPDDSAIAYYSRDNPRGIHVMPLDGSEASTVIVRAKGLRVSAPAWRRNP